MKKRKYHYSLKVGRIKLNSFKNIKRKVANAIKKISAFLNRRPLTAFFIALVSLLAAILLFNFVLSKKPTEEVPREVIQEVQIFTIGEVPKIMLQGSVEKSSVIKITALSPGVVQSINFFEGSFVEKGAILANLSSNYSGGNAPSLSRQLSAVQYENIKNTYNLQKEIIDKQRQVAQNVDIQSDELRKITNESISETNTVIDLNSQILDSIDDSLENLPESDPEAQSLKQLKSQYLSANNQLRSALRNAEALSLDDKPAAQISNLQREITLKQLEIQEKGLNLSKETARLQLALALVGEASMFPAAPFSATVERVHVRVGEAVNPGTTLFTLSGANRSSNVYVKVSKETSQALSKLESSIVYIDDQTLSLYPDFISSESTDGSLHVVHYLIPEEYAFELTDNSFVKVEIPIGYPDTSSSVPFIPIDSVFQGQNEAFVFIFNEGEAKSKKVVLGDVFGRFVEVKKGLNLKDEVILSRNIISGQKVRKAS